jgi:hypothetical protein
MANPSEFLRAEDGTVWRVVTTASLSRGWRPSQAIGFGDDAVAEFRKRSLHGDEAHTWACFLSASAASHRSPLRLALSSFHRMFDQKRGEDARLAAERADTLLNAWRERARPRVIETVSSGSVG